MNAVGAIGAVTVGTARWMAWIARGWPKNHPPTPRVPGTPDSCPSECFFASYTSLDRPVLLNDWGRSAAELGWTPAYLQQRKWPSSVRLVTRAITPGEPAIIFLTNSDLARNISVEVIETHRVVELFLRKPNTRFAYRAVVRIEHLPASLRAALPTSQRWDDAGLWFQSPGVVTPFHYDSHHGLLHQLHGEKRVLLYPPHLGYAHLDPFSPLSLAGCHTSRIGSTSAFDPREVRLAASAPGATGAPFDFTLHPGQTLYIPPFWWHHVEALGLSISMVARATLEDADRMNPLYPRVLLESLVKRVGRVSTAT